LLSYAPEYKNQPMPKLAMKYLLPLLFLFPALAFGQGKDSKNTCTDTSLLQTETLKKSGIALPVFRHFCYSDQSGSYVLYLTEKQDIKQAEDKLSSAIEAHMLKMEADKSLSNVASIRDKVSADEAGMEFWGKLTEIKDIDKDGSTAAIIVYRFYNRRDDGLAEQDAFSGRIKIVMFYKGNKIIIRAVTGNLDGERSTTATDNFFTLPVSVQKYMVQKMKAMYENGQFGFDNSYQFKPVKPKAK